MNKSPKHYFGTDGIRGMANERLTPELAVAVGLAVGAYFRNGDRRHRAVIGKDTRRSGYMLEAGLQAGLNSAGMDVFLTGPIPTPGLAMFTKSYGADLGIMITASHNPYQDNGIKIFGRDGYKLSDEQESEIERFIHLERAKNDARSQEIGRATRIDAAQERYIEFAKHTLPPGLGGFEGLRIVLDCANGAAYKIGPQILNELGAEVFPIGVTPDGYNINDHVGSTSPAALQAKVRELRADVGIAFDGDADRVLFVDEHGTLVDGDQLLAIVAQMWKEENRLTKPVLVATVMSNLGLDDYLSTLGIDILRTKVGDRHVLEAMREQGLNLGGEQSGHIIMSDYTTTGDGLIAALQILAVLKRQGKPMSEIAHRFEPVPQVLRSISFKKGTRPLEDERVQAEISAGLEKLGEKGLVVRPSGTEEVIRIMAQSKNPAFVYEVANNIEQAIKEVGI